MDTIWEYSPEIEAKRLLNNAHQIATGFFRLHGFLPLPYPAPAGDNIVATPDLPYLSIPRFWDRVSRLNINSVPITAPPDLIKSATTLLKSAHLPPPQFAVTQKLWTQHQDQIMSTIYQLIPSKKNAVTKLRVYPTVISTGCSFNVPPQFPAEVGVWLRDDKGIASLVEAVLSALTRKDINTHLSGMWSEAETVVDWLLMYSPLHDLLTKIDPKLNATLTIKSTRTKQQASLVTTSQTFLEKIGAPNVNISTLRRLPKNGFSPREKQVLDLLVSHPSQVVTMDEIGDVLFKDNLDAYSLAAIAKTIQRLRDKLEHHGISGSFIQTKRGEGYLLVN